MTQQAPARIRSTRAKSGIAPNSAGTSVHLPLIYSTLRGETAAQSTGPRRQRPDHKLLSQNHRRDTARVHSGTDYPRTYRLHEPRAKIKAAEEQTRRKMNKTERWGSSGKQGRIQELYLGRERSNTELGRRIGSAGDGIARRAGRDGGGGEGREEEERENCEGRGEARKRFFP